MLGEVLGVVISIIVTGFLWLFPVIMGVRHAKKAGLSPHWMWFGVHPLGGWIAYIILRKRAKESAESYKEQNKYKVNFKAQRVLCNTCGKQNKLKPGFCQGCGTSVPVAACPLCGGGKLKYYFKNSIWYILCGIALMLPFGFVMEMNEQASPGSSEETLSILLVFAGVIAATVVFFLGFSKSNKYVHCFECNEDYHYSKIGSLYTPGREEKPAKEQPVQEETELSKDTGVTKKCNTDDIDTSELLKSMKKADNQTGNDSTDKAVFWVCTARKDAESIYKKICKIRGVDIPGVKAQLVEFTSVPPDPLEDARRVKHPGITVIGEHNVGNGPWYGAAIVVPLSELGPFSTWYKNAKYRYELDDIWLDSIVAEYPVKCALKFSTYYAENSQVIDSTGISEETAADHSAVCNLCKQPVKTGDLVMNSSSVPGLMACEKCAREGVKSGKLSESEAWLEPYKADTYGGINLDNWKQLLGEIDKKFIDVASAIIKWWREEAVKWWQEGEGKERTKAICDSCGTDVKRGYGFKNSSNLVCKKCAISILSKNVNWDKAIMALQTHLGPNLPQSIMKYQKKNMTAKAEISKAGFKMTVGSVFPRGSSVMVAGFPKGTIPKVNTKVYIARIGGGTHEAVLLDHTNMGNRFALSLKYDAEETIKEGDIVFTD